MASIVLIANPGTKRCERFVRASGHTTIVVPWLDLITSQGNLDSIRAFDEPTIVRLESPGKNTQVTRALCSLPESEPIPRGQLVQPRRWYAGFTQVLHRLKNSFDARPHLVPLACQLAIAEMFDKNRTLARLATVGVPVPEWLPEPEIPSNPGALFEQVRSRGWRTAYVKLNTGASAVGIVVLHFDSLGEPVGQTTILRRNGHFYNTRRLQTVQGERLHQVLEFLLTEGATIQRGIPHAQLDGQNADLRVVCLQGEPVATIFRLSPHPITNLHLGGRRGDGTSCRKAIPNRTWLDALDHARMAANCFRTTMAGVDLIFEQGFHHARVIEVNAFGYFFPGWTDDEGRSLEERELAVILSKSTR